MYLRVFFLSDMNNDKQLKSVSKKGKKKKDMNFAGSLEGKKTLKKKKLNTNKRVQKTLESEGFTTVDYHILDLGSDLNKP